MLAGADSEHIDCFIGPHPESELVFVVDQETESGRFDEAKVLFGFLNKVDARAGYLENYPAGWRCGPITALTIEQFKAWLASGDTSKRIEGQVSKYARKAAPGQGSLSFDEDQPRDEDGKWTKGRSSGTAKPKEKTRPMLKLRAGMTRAEIRETVNQHVADIEQHLEATAADAQPGIEKALAKLPPKLREKTIARGMKALRRQLKSGIKETAHGIVTNAPHRLTEQEDADDTNKLANDEERIGVARIEASELWDCFKLHPDHGIFEGYRSQQIDEILKDSDRQWEDMDDDEQDTVDEFVYGRINKRIESMRRAVTEAAEQVGIEINWGSRRTPEGKWVDAQPNYSVEQYARGRAPGEEQRSLGWNEEDQPRDEDGKWTKGGGGSSRGQAKMKLPAHIAKLITASGTTPEERRAAVMADAAAREAYESMKADEEELADETGEDYSDDELIATAWLDIDEPEEDEPENPEPEEDEYEEQAEAADEPFVMEKETQLEIGDALQSLMHVEDAHDTAEYIAQNLEYYIDASGDAPSIKADDLFGLLPHEHSGDYDALHAWRKRLAYKSITGEEYDPDEETPENRREAEQKADAYADRYVGRQLAQAKRGIVEALGRIGITVTGAAEQYARNRAPGEGQRSLAWAEEDHPRADDGKFATSEGGGAKGENSGKKEPSAADYKNKHVDIEQQHKIADVREASTKEYKRTPGNFQAACAAAVQYAKDGGKKAMLVVGALSNMHKIFHILDTNADLMSVGSDLGQGADQQNIAIVTDQGEVFHAIANRKPDDRGEYKEPEEAPEDHAAEISRVEGEIKEHEDFISQVENDPSHKRGGKLTKRATKAIEQRRQYLKGARNELEGIKERQSFADKHTSPGLPELYDATAAGERWITIGGEKDAETGERHGGFPVLIDSEGNIKAGGPPSLRGHNVRDAHEVLHSHAEAEREKKNAPPPPEPPKGKKGKGKQQPQTDQEKKDADRREAVAAFHKARARKPKRNIPAASTKLGGIVREVVGEDAHAQALLLDLVEDKWKEQSQAAQQYNAIHGQMASLLAGDVDYAPKKGQQAEKREVIKRKKGDDEPQQKRIAHNNRAATSAYVRNLTKYLERGGDADGWAQKTGFPLDSYVTANRDELLQMAELREKVTGQKINRGDLEFAWLQMVADGELKIPSRHDPEVVNAAAAEMEGLEGRDFVYNGHLDISTIDDVTAEEAADEWRDPFGEDADDGPLPFQMSGFVERYQADPALRAEYGPTAIREEYARKAAPGARSLWDEEDEKDHPRAADGKWTKGEGETTAPEENKNNIVANKISDDKMEDDASKTPAKPATTHEDKMETELSAKTFAGQEIAGYSQKDLEKTDERRKKAIDDTKAMMAGQPNEAFEKKAKVYQERFAGWKDKLPEFAEWLNSQSSLSILRNFSQLPDMYDSWRVDVKQEEQRKKAAAQLEQSKKEAAERKEKEAADKAAKEEKLKNSKEIFEFKGGKFTKVRRTPEEIAAWHKPGHEIVREGVSVDLDTDFHNTFKGQFETRTSIRPSHNVGDELGVGTVKAIRVLGRNIEYLVKPRSKAAESVNQRKGKIEWVKSQEQFLRDNADGNWTPGQLEAEWAKVRAVKKELGI